MPNGIVCQYNKLDLHGHLVWRPFLNKLLCFAQFFASKSRIKAVREMIMVVTTEQRQAALDKLLPYQRSDFEGIFRVMDGMIFFSCILFYCLDSDFSCWSDNILIQPNFINHFAFTGVPVTIRLLDPPLHEFLPEGDINEIVSKLASDTGVSEDEVFFRMEKLFEVNPMLGFHGCRCVAKPWFSNACLITSIYTWESLK